MAGRAELPKRKPVAIHDLPPNVRAFAEHLAAAVAADILREIPAGDWAKIGRSLHSILPRSSPKSAGRPYEHTEMN